MRPIRTAFLFVSLSSVLVLVLGLDPATSLAQAPAVESTDAEARALFEAGRQAFSAAEYERALDYFERAYELSGRAELLYNVGQSADRARRDDVARDAYERFLEAVPDSSYRDQVETRIAFLRAQAAAEEPEPLAEAAPAPPPEVAPESTETEAPERASRAGAWALLGGGGAVAIAGGVLLGLGRAARGRVEDAPIGTPWADVSDDYTRAAPFGNAGIAGLAAGLAAAGAGLTWALLAGEDGEERGSLSVAVGPRGLVLEGSF